MATRILIVAPHGSGEVMAARGWPRTFPAWKNSYSQLTASLVARAARVWESDELLPEPPFRAPHPSVSAAGLVGDRGRPGEVSLAHGGTLFLDDVGEFRGVALDRLDEALRRGHVTSTGRDGESVTFPARPYYVIGHATPDGLSDAVVRFFRKGASS